MQQPKQDAVDAKKIRLLEQSADDALPLIADLFTRRSRHAAAQLVARIDANGAQLGDVDGAADYARARIAAAVDGKELTVSDLQLISALASEKAAADTRNLRRSDLVGTAAAAVQRVTGSFPNAPVLVMAAETALLGLGGEERGSFMSDARVITVQPGVTAHTLRHELVHATQPPPPQSGPAYCRREMIEGTTDALALAAGSSLDDLSYAPQLAAVLAFADVLGRPCDEWLRALNSTATPELTIGEAIGVDANIACGLFADAQFAAEGHDLDLDDRIEAAARIVRTGLSTNPGSC